MPKQKTVISAKPAGFDSKTELEEMMKESDRGFVLILHPLIRKHLTDAAKAHARGLLSFANLGEEWRKQADSGLVHINPDNAAFWCFTMGLISGRQFVGFRDLTELRNTAAHPTGPFSLMAPTIHGRALRIIELLGPEGGLVLAKSASGSAGELRQALAAVGYVLATDMLRREMASMESRAQTAGLIHTVV